MVTPVQPWAWQRWAVWLLFAGLVVVGAARHEMWRDEVFPWLLAAEARTPAELWQNLRHDGATPGLWHGLLWLLTRITRDVRAMQLLHAAISLAALGIWLRFAPFRLGWVAVLALGYHLLYEYALIARCYALGWLALTCFCVTARARPHSYLGVAVALAILSNTSLVGTVMAVGLAVVLFIEAAGNPAFRAPATRPRWNLPASLVIFGLGLLLVALQMAVKHETLPRDALTQLWMMPGKWPSRLAPAATNIWCALVPVPFGFPSLPFFCWGFNIREMWTSAPAWWWVGLGALVWSATTVALARDRLARYLWVTGSGLLFLFNVIGGHFALRHAGHYFLLYLVCDWLAEDARRQAGGAAAGGRWLDGWRTSWRAGLLSIHLVAGVYAWSADYRFVFSAGRSVADFIRQRGWAGDAIYTVNGSEAMPVAAYLNQPLRFLHSGEFRRFTAPTATNAASIPEMMTRCLDECFIGRRSGIVLSVADLAFSVDGQDRQPGPLIVAPRNGSPMGIRLEPLDRFPALVGSESYYVLRLEYLTDLPAPAN